jgi:DNA-binding transcriptional regulator YiaG
MNLQTRTQLHTFVTEGLARIGEPIASLEADADLQTAAVKMVHLQLIELADVLEIAATQPNVFDRQESYAVVNGIIYQRCPNPPNPTDQQHFWVQSKGKATIVWRKVFLGNTPLTLTTIQGLSTDEAIAKAATLREAVDRLSAFEASCSSLDSLSKNLAEMFGWLSSNIGKPRHATTTPEALLFETDSITAIPTAVAMVSSIYAQLRKDLWQQSDDGIGYFQHRAKGNPNNYVEHYITSTGDIEILPWEQAEQIIDKFGFTTVKLHLLFAAHTMNQDDPWKSSFVLRATDVLRELGWDRRTDLPMHDKLNEVAKAASVLDCLLVKSVWIEGRSRKGGVDASTPTGRMWTVVVEPYGQLGVDGTIAKIEEVYLAIQPGLIFERFLNKAGSKLKQALYQFGYIAQEVLKIDPYHDELALRLAIHLTMDSRIHVSGRYQVGTLLDTILPKTIIENARKDYRRAFDLKKRWDNAVTLLMQLNWSVEFDDGTYLEALRPNSPQRSPRGYLEKLLAAVITIRPRTPIPELITTKPDPKPARRMLKAIAISSEQIRQAREAKNWSQRQLAGWIGVSQSLVNLWEKGKRTPNAEQEAHLRAVLGIPN